VDTAFTDAGGVSGLVHYALTPLFQRSRSACITTQYDSANLGLVWEPDSQSRRTKAPLRSTDGPNVYATTARTRPEAGLCDPRVDKGFVITRVPTNTCSPERAALCHSDAPYTSRLPAEWTGTST